MFLPILTTRPGGTYVRNVNPCAQNQRFLAKIEGGQKTERVPVPAIVWAIRKKYVAGQGLLSIEKARPFMRRTGLRATWSLNDVV